MLYTSLLTLAATRSGPLQGTPFLLEPGDVCVSTSRLERRLGWTRDKVRWGLKKLGGLGYIEKLAVSRQHGTVWRLSDWRRSSRSEEAESRIKPATNETPDEAPNGDARPLRLLSPSTPNATPNATPTEYRDDVRDVETSLRSVSTSPPSFGEKPLQKLMSEEGRNGLGAGELTQAIVAGFAICYEMRVGLRPGGAELRKQGAAARRVAQTHDAEHIARALMGMENLYPYTHEGWDVFALERQFSRAVQTWMGADPQDAHNRRILMQLRAE